MNDDDYTLVYSSNNPGVNLKKKKKEKQVEKAIIPSDITLGVKVEKKGRGGKIVTIIDNIPYAPSYFKKLHKNLKAYCGVGGTIKEKSLEIQGDNLVKVKSYLEKEGFKVVQ